MATYAIGDIQGCYTELISLLDKINFDPAADRLWFTGDLVNRGPCSLEVLEFVKSLGDAAVTVLGNHDLHLLAIAHGIRRQHKKDTLDGVLAATNRKQLLEWLRHRPILHHDPDLEFTLVHAGLAPQWDLPGSQRRATEIESVLRGEQFSEFLKEMYGDTPDRWDPGLTGWDRLRFITNCFTRLRFCDRQGRLDLECKGPPGSQPANLLPWYAVPDRRSRPQRIVFGHWSTLKLGNDEPVEFNAYPLDTGCVWGDDLTALRLEDQKLSHVPMIKEANNGCL